MIFNIEELQPDPYRITTNLESRTVLIYDEKESKYDISRFIKQTIIARLEENKSLKNMYLQRKSDYELKEFYKK